MTDLLFVYGTLCCDCTGQLGQLERLRLARESTVLCSAAVPGRMVDLGGYPGLVDGSGLVDSPGVVDSLGVADRPGRVEGIVLRLNWPEQTWAWLDAYEGAGCDGAEYDRVATLTLGGRLQPESSPMVVWVYRLRDMPWPAHSPAVFVAGERWPGRASLFSRSQSR